MTHVPLKKRDLRIRLKPKDAEGLAYLMGVQDESATQVITQLIFTATEAAKENLNDNRNKSAR